MSLSAYEKLGAGVCRLADIAERPRYRSRPKRKPKSGDATLYLPRRRQGKVPAMLFSPGHAMEQGR